MSDSQREPGGSPPRATRPKSTMCFHCQATNVPLQWDDDQGTYVTVTHKDEAHGTDPCSGSGKPWQAR
jgi:hypothetical protein